jgi:hypothetical protein
MFLMDRRLTGSRMETVQASFPPQRVRPALLSPEYHLEKRGRGEVGPQLDQPSSTLATFVV